YTVDGVTYGYRSGTLTADSSLAEGSTSYSITAADYAGNSTTNSSFSVTVDNTAPTVDASVIPWTSSTTPGYIAQGDAYYVYANASETHGLDSITANASDITGSETPLALTSSSYSVDGVTYGYRSHTLTADSSLAEGSTSYSVTATDYARNSTTDSSFSV